MTGPMRRRQGGRFPIFIRKNLHRVQIFSDKDKKRPMLPQAKPAFIG
jgi:hypothetical protein